MSKKIILVLGIIIIIILLNLIIYTKKVNKNQNDTISHTKEEIISLYTINKKYFINCIDYLSQFSGHVYIAKTPEQLITEINGKPNEFINDELEYIINELKFVVITKFDNSNLQFMIRDDFSHHGIIFIKDDTTPEDNGGESYEKIEEHWYYIDKKYT